MLRGPLNRPLPWLLAFQMMGAAVAGPWYALQYLTDSPVVAGPAPGNHARGFLAAPSASMIVPVALAIGYVLPAILMALPSPQPVSNGFQQMAVVAWNLFPVLVSLVQTALETSSSMLGLVPATKKPSPQQHLRAVRVAYVCGLIVSAASHIAIVSLSATTVLFPFFYQAEYIHAFSPKALIVPPTSWASVANIGEGVRGFLLWDQVWSYATMLLLALVQLARVAPASVKSFGTLRLTLSVLVGIVVAGPGSVCMVLNWIGDESVIQQDLAAADGEERSSNEKRKAVA